jgi:hypothetical protein
MLIVWEVIKQKSLTITNQLMHRFEATGEKMADSEMATRGSKHHPKEITRGGKDESSKDDNGVGHHHWQSKNHQLEGMVASIEGPRQHKTSFGRSTQGSHLCKNYMLI